MTCRTDMHRLLQFCLIHMQGSGQVRGHPRSNQGQGSSAPQQAPESSTAPQSAPTSATQAAQGMLCLGAYSRACIHLLLEAWQRIIQQRFHEHLYPASLVEIISHLCMVNDSGIWHNVTQHRTTAWHSVQLNSSCGYMHGDKSRCLSASVRVRISLLMERANTSNVQVRVYLEF